MNEEDSRLERCYFCEVPYVYPSFFMHFENELFVCCETAVGCEFMIDKLNTIIENEECPICLETKRTIELPTCNHRVCLKCCKTIYFGKNDKNIIPIHPNEIDFNIKFPQFPYQILDEEGEEEDDEEKLTKYYEFKDKYFNFDFDNKKIEELLKIRDDSMLEREEWMNTEIFIDYENKRFEYDIESDKADKAAIEWEKYNENKIRGNEICPFCRNKPCDWL